MKTFKKLLATLLSVLMLMLMVANFAMFSYADDNAATEPEEVFSGEAADVIDTSATEESEIQPSENVDIVDSGTCGDDLTWTLDNEGKLTIDGTGDMYDYFPYMLYGTKAPWSDYESDIKSVVIGDFVTRIGDCTFSGCTALTCVTIPASVKSISDKAFGALSEMVVDADNQYYSSDEFGVLYNKDKSELISYPMKNTRTTFTIPDSVKIIGESAFAECMYLVSIIISDSVTTMGDRAFYSCSSLENVSVGNSVSSISYCAFSNCTSLTNINIPDSVTSIGQSAFDNCPSLVSVVIPDSVTSIGAASFCRCSSLIDITVPDTLTTIPMLAFDDTAYYNDPANWEDGVLYIGKYLVGCETSLSGEYVIKDGTLCVGQYAFKNTPALTSVVIPDSVKNVNYLAFHNCASLSDVTVLGFDTILEQLTYPGMGNRDFTIHCYENSYAHTYALENDFNYELIQSEDHNCFESIVAVTDGYSTYPVCEICSVVYENLTLYSYNDDYYYIAANETVKDSLAYVNGADTGLESGWYKFESDGKMMKTGFVVLSDYSGTPTYYYENAQRVKGLKKIGDDYYFFNLGSGVMCTNTSIWIGENDYGFASGDYYFGEDGTMVVTTLEGDKQIIEENGNLYFIVNGEKQYNGLFELDGDCYYVAHGTIVRDSVAWVSDNSLMGKGWYKFESDGKLMATGFMETPNGYTYYFEDHELVKGFTKLGDDYYFFNLGSGMMYQNAELWVGENDYGIKPGMYSFDENGCMIIPEPVNGIVAENGNLLYYVDGEAATPGVYNENGCLYYVVGGGYIVKDQVAWVSNTNGIVAKSGYYSFDEDGKMMATGFMEAPNGYTYYFEDYELVKGFTKLGDDYYFFNLGSGMMYQDAYLWVGTNDYGITPGTYYFGADGTMQ